MVSILQNSLKEKRRRSIYKNAELKRTHYKYIKLNASNIGYIYCNNLSILRLRNLCLITGHTRSIYTKNLRVSRHQIKEYFSFIKGLRLSSW